jgi:hypothetical protein
MVKRILAGLALGALWMVACAIVMLPGCASTGGLEEAHAPKVELAAQAATILHIREAKTPAARAERVARIRGAVRDIERLADVETVTVAELLELARTWIAPDASPDDRAAALALITALRASLDLELAAGALSPETRLSVKRVLSAVDQVAAIYATS